MATTSKKFGYRPGSGHVYIPTNATIQQPKPRKLRTNTQNIVEPLKPTQLTGTYASHGNGPQKRGMATTGRPGSGHIYIPPNATIQQPKPSKLRTNTQNIVEPLTFGTRGL